MAQTIDPGAATSGSGDAAILSPPPTPVASSEDLDAIEKRLLSEWSETAPSESTEGPAEESTTTDLFGMEIPVGSMRDGSESPNVETSSEATTSETSEPQTAPAPGDDPNAEAVPADAETISVEESERRQAQAVNATRENLLRQQQVERERIEAEAKATAETNAERERMAQMSDAELANYYRNQQAVDELKKDVRPEILAEVLNTLNNDIGPKVMDALGVSNDQREWPEPLLKSWTQAPPESLDARIKFFHDFAVEQAVALATTDLRLQHEQAIAKLKGEYEGADVESTEAESRNAIAEPSLVGDQGRSGSRGIIQIEEAIASGGMGTLSPAERQTIDAFYSRQGITAR